MLHLLLALKTWERKLLRHFFAEQKCIAGHRISHLGRLLHWLRDASTDIEPMIFFERATVFWQQCIVSQGLEESKTGCGTKTPCHGSDSFVFEVQIR